MSVSREGNQKKQARGSMGMWVSNGGEVADVMGGVVTKGRVSKFDNKEVWVVGAGE